MQARALDIEQNLWLRGHILQTLACFLTRGFAKKLCLLCSVRAVKTCFVLGLRTDWNVGHGTQRDKRRSLSDKTLEHVQSLCFRHGHLTSPTCFSDDCQCLPAQLQDISVTNGSDKKMQTDNLTELYRNISSLQEERRLAERPTRIAEAVRIPATKRTTEQRSLLIIELHSLQSTLAGFRVRPDFNFLDGARSRSCGETVSWTLQYGS